jgi:uncharacterized membrane-anchored protein YhcB (DUF1043 family)
MRSKEILLLDCEEPESSNFLSELRSEGQASMKEKQAKRVESIDEHQDWSTVGSGLLVKHKGNTRESEPQ